MTHQDDPRAAPGEQRAAPDRSRAARVPRVTSAALAIPIVLALGIASLAMFLVGVTTLLVGPRLRDRSARTSRRGRTITLGRTAYRTVDRDGPEARGTGDRTLTIAMTPRHDGGHA